MRDNNGLNAQRPYLDEAWLYLEYVIKSRTMQDIASEWNVSRQRIGQLVKLYRLTEKRNALRKPYTNKEWLAGELDKRKTQQEIAIECGVDHSTISVWARKYKLKRRFFTKKELTQRNVARQNRLCATDPEYRKMKLENSVRWKEQNPERWKKYWQEYGKKRRRKEAMSE